MIRCRAFAHLLLALGISGSALAFPGYLRRLDTIEDWESISLGHDGIKHVVPGPSPVPGPDGLPVPGDPEYPCLDFVLYGPGIQHIDIIRSTHLECLADFTNETMNRMRLALTQYAGYITRMRDPVTGKDLSLATIHNDIFEGPPAVEPSHVSYVLRQIRLTYNEEVLGKVVYLPIWGNAQTRARQWLADPSVTLDFEIYFFEEEDPAILRGDADGDGRIDIGDAVVTLGSLFIGRQPPGCLDAADMNDSGDVDITDPISTLAFLFLGGGPPAAPYPICDLDPTEDGLDCASPPVCN
jgi:hypothetical protein